MSGRPVVRIASFRHMLNVLSTKQRPRKLTVLGNDGQRYLYLLKGALSRFLAVMSVYIYLRS